MSIHETPPLEVDQFDSVRSRTSEQSSTSSRRVVAKTRRIKKSLIFGSIGFNNKTFYEKIQLKQQVEKLRTGLPSLAKEPILAYFKLTN
eukprot:gene3675-7316_t